MPRAARSSSALLRSEAARCMLPGLARPSEAEELLLHLIRALSRVKTWPGSGDHAFIKTLDGKRYGRISPEEHEHVLVLAWRYRAQFPPSLRGKLRAKYDI